MPASARRLSHDAARRARPDDQDVGPLRAHDALAATPATSASNARWPARPREARGAIGHRPPTSRLPTSIPSVTAPAEAVARRPAPERVRRPVVERVDLELRPLPMTPARRVPSTTLTECDGSRKILRLPVAVRPGAASRREPRSGPERPGRSPRSGVPRAFAPQHETRLELVTHQVDRIARTSLTRSARVPRRRRRRARARRRADSRSSTVGLSRPGCQWLAAAALTISSPNRS